MVSATNIYNALITKVVHLTTFIYFCCDYIFHDSVITTNNICIIYSKKFCLNVPIVYSWLNTFKLFKWRVAMYSYFVRLHVFLHLSVFSFCSYVTSATIATAMWKGLCHIRVYWILQILLILEWMESTKSRKKISSVFKIWYFLLLSWWILSFGFYYLWVY